MRKTSSNQSIDQLAEFMIRSFSEKVGQEYPQEKTNPYFMIKLRTHINEANNTVPWWGAGVITAQKWLVALSFIALIFFVGNLYIMIARPYSILEPQNDSIVADHDWDHLDDLISESGK